MSEDDAAKLESGPASAEPTAPTSPPEDWAAPSGGPWQRPSGYQVPLGPPGHGWGPPSGRPHGALWGPPPVAPRPPTRSKAPLVVGLAIGAVVVVALVLIGGGVAATRAVNDGGQSFDEAAADAGGRTNSRSEKSSEAGADALGDGWALKSAGPEPVVAPACAPEGWMDGATDQHRTEYEKRGFTHTEATVVVTTFATEAQQEAAVELAHTPEYHECVRLDAVALSRGDVTVIELPPDPRTPGVAFEATDDTGYQVWRFVIGVGVQRSTITFCGCDTGFEIRRDVALDIAAAMAAAQGLPSPG